MNIKSFSKRRILARNIAALFIGGSILTPLVAPSAQAATYYWDNNGATAGFGTAAGTWAAPTLGDNTQGWGTSATGVVLPVNRTTLNTSGAVDALNFGNGATGLAAGTITVSGTVSAGNMTFATGSGAITLSGGTIDVTAAGTITTNNSTNTIDSAISGAATSLTKAGLGTLVLSGTNTYTGSTIINAGTLDLGGGTANGSLDSTVLTLGGGSLNYTRTGTNTQSFTTTSITGASMITGSAGNTLNLGTVSRGTNNRFYDFGTTGLGIVAADTASNVNGIMAGFTVGDSWAVANGSGVAISGLANGSYTLTSLAGTTSSNYTNNNIDVNNSAGALDGAINANSLRFSTAGANTLTLNGSGNVITSGGILVGSGVGANLSTITGGELAGAAGKDLVVVQNNVAGELAISSNIVDNTTATGLTKSGPGVLTLSGVNSYTGGTVIHAGTLKLSGTGTPGPTGSSVAVSSGALLDLNGTNQSILFTAGTGVGTVANNSGSGISTLTLAGNATVNGSHVTIVDNTTTPGGKVAVVIQRNTQPLSNLNTYSGGTTVNAGAFLYLTAASSLGAGTGPINLTAFGGTGATSSGLLVDGTTYANDITGDGYIHNNSNSGATVVTTTFTGNINTSGPVIFRAGTGITYNFAGNGTTSELSGVIGSTTSMVNGAVASGRITKSGTGTLTLSGANVYTGRTTVSNGKLILSGNRTAEATGGITVGDTASQTGMLDISAGNFNIAGSFIVGTGDSTVAGIVNQTGGDLTMSGTLQLLVGGGGTGTTAGTASTGTYNLSGGSLGVTAPSANRGILLGVNSGATGTFNLSDTGTISMGSSFMEIGRSSSTATGTTGVFNQTGGSATFGSFSIGGGNGPAFNGTTGTLNITGGTFSAGALTLLSAGDNSTSTINIGGTAVVTLPAFPTVRGAGSTATINFDGGTLKPTATSATYMGGLTNAFIKANGANFDTNNFDITISQNLLTDPVSTGGGLSKSGTGTLTLTGANTYTGATTVSGGTLQLNGSAAVSPTTSGLAVNGGRFGITTGIGSTLDLAGKPVALGGTLAIDIGATGVNDSLNVGSFSLTANSDVVFNPIGAITSGASYTLVNSATPITTNGFSLTGQNFGKLSLTPTINTNTITVTPNLAEGIWSNTGSGVWSNGDPNATAGNWTNYKPTVIGDAALFGSAITGPATVTVDAQHTVGYLRFDNAANSYTIGTNGSSNLTLENSNAPAIVAVNSGSHTIAENVGLVSNALIFPAAGTTLTVSGAISGAGSLQLYDAGNLVLSGANTYTGGTIINAGKLTMSGAGTLETSSALTLAGGSLDLGTTSQTVGAVSITAPAASGDTISNGNLTGTSYAASNATGNAVVSANLLGTSGFTKSDAGAVTLAGANTYTGNTIVSGGTLNITGTLTGNTTTSTLVLGAAGSNTVTNVSNDMTLFAITGANTASSNVAYNQTAGNVNLSSGLTMAVNAATTGSGSFNLTGGTLNINAGNFIITNNANGSGSAYVGGTGTLNIANTGTNGGIAWAGTGVLTVGPGGTVTRATGTNAFYLTAFANSTGTLNVAGGNMDLGTGLFRMGNGAAIAGINGSVNLASGTLTMGANTTNSALGANLYVNFAGGTLKASADLNSPFSTGGGVTTTSTIFGAIDNVGTSQDFTGGLTMDTNGNNVTYGNALLGATGNGVVPGNLIVTGGSDYVGAPNVTFTGGTLAANGSPASGYATISGGAVTGIVITSPGQYIDAPTVTLTGGGGTGANIAVGTISANAADTGLTKIGEGTLTLTAANTYAGGTTISAGTLQVGSGGTVGTGPVTNNATFDVARAGLATAAITGTGTTAVSTTGASLTASSIRQAGLTIGAGNTVTVAANGTNSGVSRVTSALSIAGGATPTGTLDLKDNDLVVGSVDLTTALATHTLLNEQVEFAFNGLAWDQPGITSSTVQSDIGNGVPTGLGILLNNVGGGPGDNLFYGDGGAFPTFSGQAVNEFDTLVKYTWLGDANLDGIVDSVDFGLFQAGFSNSAPYTGWAFGDFDYNGVVDSVDFGLFQAGFGAQTGPLLTSGDSSALAIAAVPEPGTWVLGGLGLLGLAGMQLRRRKQLLPRGDR